MIYIDNYLSDIVSCIDKIKNLNKLKGKSVFVTGASGLIGSAIVDMLLVSNKKHETNIKIFVGGRDKKKIDSRFGEYKDCLNYIEYEASRALDNSIKFDYIIHCASFAHPELYAKFPVETIETSINSTLNILNYAKMNYVDRIIYISSSEVYGTKQNLDFYHEDEYSYLDILNPRACYPSSKRLCETLFSSFKDEYGVDFVVARPGHIYGAIVSAKDTRASAQFLNNVLEGKNIVMKSSGNQLRSYCYVLDCASAIITILLNGTSGEAYNISNNNSVVTIKEFAEMVANVSNHKVIMSLPTNSEVKGYNLMSCSALTSKKVENIGWTPLFNLEEGVNRTYEIMKSQISYEKI